MLDLKQWEGYKHIAKAWGTEIVLDNNPAYCAKFLVISPGFTCSLHRHDIKRETFHVVEGRVGIEFGSDPSFLRTEAKDVGDALHVPPGLFHRFWSMTPERAILLEVSSHHDDLDVERLEESRAL